MDILDRKRKPITVGVTIQVQHCVGRYGQTQVTEGVVTELDIYKGATLRLTKPSIAHFKGSRKPVAPGESYYVCLPGRVDNGAWLCDHEHFDFEHGHLAWAEIVEPK